MAASSTLSLVWSPSTRSRFSHGQPNTHFTFSTSLRKTHFCFQSPIISSSSSPSSVIPKFSRSQEQRKREDTIAVVMVFGRKLAMNFLASPISESSKHLLITEDTTVPLFRMCTLSFGATLWFAAAHAAHAAHASGGIKTNAVYETGELFELGIQLSYLLLLLGLLGAGTFFVIRQVLLRRELDLSAKELQEQVRSGNNSATGLFELGAVMLRRKFYPAAIKYLLQAIDQWDGEYEDLAQVYNALGVSYVRDDKLDKGIAQFETAVKIQPGYVTAWNNLGDAYEKKKDIKAALKAFEEVLLFDPDNKVAKPRRDGLKERVEMYKGVPVKFKGK